MKSLNDSIVLRIESTAQNERQYESNNPQWVCFKELVLLN